jgi:hypothetical protein
MLTTAGRHDSLILSYGPRFSYLDIEGDRNVALMHAGHADLAWWTRRFRLTFTLDGSIGTQSAVGLVAPLTLGGGTTIGTPVSGGTTTPTGPPPVTPQLPVPTFIPQLLVLYTGSFRGAVGASYSFSRKWYGNASAFFVMAGGIDYDSQQQLPPYRGPGGELSASYVATRQDTFVTRLRPTYTWVITTQGDFLAIEAMESIRHSWSRRTVSTLGAGVSFLRARANLDEGHTGAITGAGEASIVNTMPLRSDSTIATRAAVLLGTAFNPVVAVVQQQLSAVLSSMWTRGRLSVTVSVDAVASVPFNDKNASRVASGGVMGGYLFAAPLQLQLGTRAYAQVLPASTGVSYPPQWVTFAAVALRSPALGF